MELECIPVGCVPSTAGGVCLGGFCQEGGVSAQGGVFAQRVSVLGVSAQKRGVCQGRVSAQEGGVCQGRVSARGVSPMWTEFLTHVCENITFPQLLLRTAIIMDN